MLKALANSWWTFAVRGAFALLFAMGALSYPGLTVLLLIIFFGVYALVDGATSLVLGIGGKKRPVYLLLGLVSIAAGVFALARPGATAVALLWLIGIWAVVKGIGEIVAAIQIRKEVEGEWAIALSGVISVLFGALRARAAWSRSPRPGVADRDLPVCQRHPEADAGLQTAPPEEGAGVRRGLTDSTQFA